MVEARPEEDIATPKFGNGNIDDRIEGNSEEVTGCARSLRQSQRRITQGKIGKDKIATQSKVFTCIAGHTGSGINASASHIRARGTAIHVGASSDVVAPILVIVNFLAP